MIYQLAEIVRDVKIVLDENMTSEELLALEDIETLSMEDVIESNVVEAIRRVESAAPINMLESGHNLIDSLFWNSDGSGFVVLPDDFMRLMAFKMSDWERTLHSAIEATDPIYAKQSSRFKGVRGNKQKPVVAIVNRPEGRVLEFYSCDNENATMEIGVYRPYPKVDEYKGVEISERCYRAVVYTIGALVLLTYGEATKASALTELSKSILV
jgi:hypothetical protein